MGYEGSTCENHICATRSSYTKIQSKGKKKVIFTVGQNIEIKKLKSVLVTRAAGPSSRCFHRVENCWSRMSDSSFNNCSLQKFGKAEIKLFILYDTLVSYSEGGEERRLAAGCVHANRVCAAAPNAQDTL